MNIIWKVSAFSFMVFVVCSDRPLIIALTMPALKILVSLGQTLKRAPP